MTFIRLRTIRIISNLLGLNYARKELQLKSITRILRTLCTVYGAHMCDGHSFRLLFFRNSNQTKQDKSIDWTTHNDNRYWFLLFFIFLSDDWWSLEIFFLFRLMSAKVIDFSWNHWKMKWMKFIRWTISDQYLIVNEDDCLCKYISIRYIFLQPNNNMKNFS